MFIAISARYGVVQKHEYDTLEEAKEMLDRAEEYGECFSIGIYDTESRTMYIKESLVAGISNEDMLKHQLKSANKIGIAPLRIEALPH